MAQAASGYAEDQEELRRTSEGEGDGVRIDIPKAPEVNPEVYKDVTQLIFRGFLVSSVELNGVHFLFKSLNQHEFEQVRFMGGFAGNDATARFWDLFLAFGVFYVDGQNMLIDRQTSLRELAVVFRELSPAARSPLIRHLSELNRRATNATILTEAYCMENASRYRWAQVHGLDLSQPAVTGTAGTEKLGLNWAQLTWRALNHYEDLSATQEREWENAKFIGSCSAGKGIQKVYTRDQERRKKDAEERIARKDKILRHIIQGISMEEGKTVRHGQVIEVAQTVEQLATQLERSLRGEKDWHDEVVEAHERRVREEHAKQQAQLQSLAEAAEKEFDGKRVLGSSDVQGLTQREVDERIQRTRQVQAQAQAQRLLRPEDGLDEKRENLLQRHGILGPSVETRVGVTDKDPSGATPITPRRQPSKPWRT